MIGKGKGRILEQGMSINQMEAKRIQNPKGPILKSLMIRN